MKYILYMLSLLTLLTCATPQTVSEPGSETTEEESIESPALLDTDNPSENDIELSRLSDTYRNKINEIPESYVRIKEESEQEEEKDLYEGYRIQIYSGQDVSMADSTARWFRAWSDTTISGYQASTYTFFRSPYYRVHVGDFHDRSRAIAFSDLLKRRFREAWVVYDRVNPWNVPADTIEISFK